MNCIYCNAKLEARKVTYNINRHGYDVIVHDVPALACPECGEVLFEEKSIDVIQSMIEELDEKAERVRSFSPKVSPPGPTP